MIIKGKDLNRVQRALVLAAFVHRPTIENGRQRYNGDCPMCRQSAVNADGHVITGPKDAPKVWTREQWHAYHVPLTTDDQWIADHAFHFTSDGKHLSAAHNYAEPAFMGDSK